MATERNDDWRDCADCGRPYGLRQRLINGKSTMLCVFCNPAAQIKAPLTDPIPPDLQDMLA